MTETQAAYTVAPAPADNSARLDETTYDEMAKLRARVVRYALGLVDLQAELEALPAARYREALEAIASFGAGNPNEIELRAWHIEVIRIAQEALKE